MESAKHSDDYAQQSPATTLTDLKVNSARGLSEAKATQRLAIYGYNEIEEKEKALWHRVFRRFWGPIPWMIEVAALPSAVVQKWDDFAIIMVMLLVNAELDFFQERRALKAFKQRLTAEVIVRCDGLFKTIPTRGLVPGDIVKRRIGKIVPPDVQLLEGDCLSVDQWALTGEFLPVSKKAGEAAYSGTVVRQCEMLAVVGV